MAEESAEEHMKDHHLLKVAPVSAFSFPVNRKLGMAGQKLGSSALLCCIRPDTVDPANSFTLTVANVGTCRAVLCRGGKPVPLSKVFSLEQDPEEAQRVKDQKAIITEVRLALASHPHPLDLVKVFVTEVMKVHFFLPCPVNNNQSTQRCISDGSS